MRRLTAHEQAVLARVARRIPRRRASLAGWVRRHEDLSETDAELVDAVCLIVMRLAARARKRGRR